MTEASERGTSLNRYIVVVSFRCVLNATLIMLRVRRIESDLAAGALNGCMTGRPDRRLADSLTTGRPADRPTGGLHGYLTYRW